MCKLLPWGEESVGLGALMGDIAQNVRTLFGARSGRCVAFVVGPLLLLAVLAAALLPALSAVPPDATAAILLLAVGIVCVRNTALFVFVLLCAATNVFGLVDLSTNKSLGVPTYDVVLFALLAVLAATNLFRGESAVRDHSRRLPGAMLWATLAGIAAFVVYSAIKWDQTLWTSVKAAHDVTFFVLALFGLFVRLDEHGLFRCVQAFIVAGCVTAAIPVAGLFVPAGRLLPGLLSDNAYAVAGTVFYRAVPQCFFLIYISFLLLLYDNRLARGATRQVLLGFLGLSIVLLGYRAGWIAIAGTIGWLAIRDARGNSSAIARTIVQFAIVAGLVAAAVWLSGADSYVSQRLSGVREDLAQSGRPVEVLGSLSIRMFQIRALGAIFARQPLFGAGFIHGDGPAAGLAREFGLRYVSTNDVGWIDILARTGIVGSACFCSIVFLALQWLRRLESSSVGRFARAVRAYLWFGLFFLVGGAPFSCPIGVVPLALLLGVAIAAYPAAEEATLASEGGADSVASSDLSM